MHLPPKPVHIWLSTKGEYVIDSNQNKGRKFSNEFKADAVNPSNPPQVHHVLATIGIMVLIHPRVRMNELPRFYAWNLLSSLGELSHGQGDLKVRPLSHYYETVSLTSTTGI